MRRIVEKNTCCTGARTDKPHTGSGTKLTMTQAAKDTGMSKRQKDTALRIANVPEDDFNEKVESDDPPTVSTLADIGTKRSEKDFQRATEALGTLRKFSEFCGSNKAEPVSTLSTTTV